MLKEILSGGGYGCHHFSASENGERNAPRFASQSN
jgi:hypothetical protein